MLQYTFVGYSMDFECWQNVKEDSNANGSIESQKISSNYCPAGKISECSSIHFNTSVTSSIVSEIRALNKKSTLFSAKHTVEIMIHAEKQEIQCHACTVW